MTPPTSEFKRLLATLFKTHPWHGVSAGPNAPEVVSSYIEIVPTGAVKLELDKATGHLHVDRPQRFSSMCPTLYGFIPQTYCGERVGQLAADHIKKKNVKGDGDPLDICVLTEKDFAHGDLFVTVRPIGGLRMIDHGEADDKIIAVLENDIAYGGIKDVSEVPKGVIDRLEHYFLSYKSLPTAHGEKPIVSIAGVYGREEALEVIRLSQRDYEQVYGTEESRLDQLRQILSVALPAPQSVTVEVITPKAPAGSSAKHSEKKTKPEKPEKPAKANKSGKKKGKDKASK